MARLIVNAGTPQVRELVLKDGVNSVGRGEANDFTISDPSVSGSHCQFVVSNGSVSLRDLGSTNGTFVNGARVTEIELKGKQQIQLGAAQLLFEPAKEGTTVAPAPRAVPVVVAIPRAATATTSVAPPKPVGLRVAGATPKEPPIIVPETDSEPPMAEAEPRSRFRAPPNAKCKYHPRTLARWMCTGCGKTYCDLCVAERHGGGMAQRFCRSCGAVASPLDVTIEAPQEKSFFRELPRAFIYPFRGSGLLILIFATILFAGLDILGRRNILGIFIKAMTIGYLYSYMQNILHSTAADEDKMPDLPAMDDLLSGFFRLVGTVLIAFGPAMVLAYLAIAEEQPMAGIALIPAIIFGALYLPMAFLAVAMKDNIMAANPLIVVPSIIRVPLAYLVTALLVAGIFGVRWLGDALTSEMVGESVMGNSVTKLLLVFGLNVIWAFFSFYLLTVTIRILGLLYLTKRERLGW